MTKTVHKLHQLPYSGSGRAGYTEIILCQKSGALSPGDFLDDETSYNWMIVNCRGCMRVAKYMKGYRQETIEKTFIEELKAL